MPICNHLGIVVSDLQRSKRFYQEVLGFRVWYEDSSVPDAAVGKLLGLSGPLAAQLCYLVLDGYAIELMHYSAPEASVTRRERTMSDTGLSHLSVSVDDIRASAARAVECGGSIVESSDLGVALMVRDPDGQLIELLRMDYPAGRPPRPTAAV
jgi:catechol 2,3-dioxygenase-like lactoylglutathione lyase family enzyme